MGPPSAARLQALDEKGYTRIFNTDIRSKGFFCQADHRWYVHYDRHDRSGPGDDAENISVKSLKGFAKNVLSFSVVMVMVNLLFLLLGGLLYLFILHNGAAYYGPSRDAQRDRFR